MLETLPAPFLSDAAPLEHGGDLAAMRARFSNAAEPWIDLSTGINPNGYPVGDLPAACFARLPESAALRALEASAAAAYGASDASNVVAANGAQALIQMLPRLLPGQRVGVLAPTYAEHALSWRRAGREVAPCNDIDELAACDVAVIVNPNNPTGRIVARDALLRLARRRLLVVDESFADLSPRESIADCAAEAGAIVLRSLGKAYGLAGLRLGFAIAPPELVAQMRSGLGPWPVSGPAIEIGSRALADSAWLAHTRMRLDESAARLDALLLATGCEILGGTSLFRLAAHDDALAIADRLGQAGIHVRRFADHPRWLRFGMPPDTGWTRLEAAMQGRAR